ncbi:hypothetical protein CK203_054411 [Vitis vinifera]|uniref:Uncharacterized protein n=1 Tax=Vitis vinifera TaxID=29760 RepID=A0A438GG59_VITVI|nr:hypothetical protein CK203_054411 [Vitis vinifera]
MDDLFRRANKYSMLEDDVRAATQQVLVAGRASRDNADRHAKPPDRPKPVDRRQDGPSRPNRPPVTPLSVSYEKLLPMIQGLPTSGAPVAPKAVINYINGGPSDEEYDSRRKRQKLLRAASIRERINSIRPGLTGEGPRPIDGTIIFPTIQPDLVQASVIGHMGHSLAGLENPGRNLIWIQRIINNILRRHYTAGSSWTSHSQRAILGGARIVTPSISSWDAHGFTT